MMFRLICLFALIAAACSASIGSADTTTSTTKRPIVPVLKFESDKHPDGSFRFMYEGGDKSFREESGVLQNAGTDDEALEVTGSYRYIDADGQVIEVHYTAGRNGFVPIGTNIASSISELAKAAADFRDNTGEEPSAADNVRKARSKIETEDKENYPAKLKKEKADKPKDAFITVKVEPVKAVAKVEKVKAVESVKMADTPITKVMPANVEEKKVEKAASVAKVENVASVAKVENVASVAKVANVASVAKVDKVEKVEKIEKPAVIAKEDKTEKVEKVEKLPTPEATVKVTEEKKN